MVIGEKSLGKSTYIETLLERVNKFSKCLINAIRV